ncbi:hypothetical protein NLG97_g1717 [Lecanicillium saksenae]|uniref:Uncharacterized protein n=1 Tax=Lecanicillium saksenae TaxID=468837 RepID=A0ACC1R3L5_9HYPO|nr:hypothetical protein NLG97_g1717 [Lecanicillium saksenae]
MQAVFDSRFRDDSDETFFLHHVDESAGSLRVQVLRCGLSQTFFHQYTGQRDQSKIALGNKTSGFLAAVKADERVVLTWAESGHGLGCNGDPLQDSKHILRNSKWASKAIQLAKILDLDLTSPFDRTHTGAAPSGSFQAAHVEVKLATYAVFLMLHMSGIHTSGHSITKKSLRKLRQVQPAPHFEVYVSRKNCNRCGAFLRKLQDLTGVRFDLKSGRRVVPIEYRQQQLLDAAELRLPQHDKGSDQRTIRTLQTYEKDGIIHYVALEDNHAIEITKDGEQPKRVNVPSRISPHHLSDVDKPLPATPVTEAPEWNLFYHQEEIGRENQTVEPALESTVAPAARPTVEPAVVSLAEAFVESVDSVPFPQRSPRPYGIRLC